MSDASSSTLKHAQPWASYAPALRLSFPPIKGDADGGSLRAAPRAPFTCHGNGRPLEAWAPGPG